MLKTLSKISALTALMVFCYMTVVAQPGDPGEDPDIPVTGIEWLLIGGGLWGAKKIYDGRKKEK